MGKRIIIFIGVVAIFGAAVFFMFMGKTEKIVDNSGNIKVNETFALKKAIRVDDFQYKEGKLNFFNVDEKKDSYVMNTNEVFKDGSVKAKGSKKLSKQDDYTEEFYTRRVYDSGKTTPDDSNDGDHIKGNTEMNIEHESEYVYGNRNYHCTYRTDNATKTRTMYIQDLKGDRTYATKKIEYGTGTFNKEGLINWVFEYEGKLYGLNLIGRVVELELKGAEIITYGESVQKIDMKDFNFLGIEGDYLYLLKKNALYSYNLKTKKTEKLIKSKNYDVQEVFHNGYVMINKKDENQVYLGKTKGSEIELIGKIKGSTNDTEAYFVGDKLLELGYSNKDKKEVDNVNIYNLK